MGEYDYLAATAKGFESHGSSGVPRQFMVMAETIRCSILFSLEVPGGGKLDFWGRPEIFSLRECLLGRGIGELGSPLSPAQKVFSLDFPPAFSAY